MDDQLRLLHEDLAQIRKEMATMRESLVKLSVMPVTIADHEMRLRTIEAFANRTKGGLALAALGGGLLSGILTTAVHVLLGT